MASSNNDDIYSSKSFSEAEIVRSIITAMNLQDKAHFNQLTEALKANADDITRLLTQVLSNLGILKSYANKEAKNEEKSATSKVRHQVNQSLQQIINRETTRITNSINNLTEQRDRTTNQTIINRLTNQINNLTHELNNFAPNMKDVILESIQNIARSLNRPIMLGGSQLTDRKYALNQLNKERKSIQSRLSQAKSISLEGSKQVNIVNIFTGNMQSRLKVLGSLHPNMLLKGSSGLYFGENIIETIKNQQIKEERLLKSGASKKRLYPSLDVLRPYDNVDYIGDPKGNIYKNNARLGTSLVPLSGTSLIPTDNPESGINYNPKDRGILVDSPISRRWTRRFIRTLINALKNLPIFQMTKNVLSDAFRLGLLAHASKQTTPRWVKKLELAFVALKGPESAVQLGSNILGSAVEGATQVALYSLVGSFLAKKFGINILGSLKAGRLRYVNPARSPLRGVPSGPIKSVNGNVINADFTRNLKHGARGASSLIDDPISIAGKGILKGGLRTAGNLAKGIGPGLALTALDIFGDPLVEKSVIGGKSPSWFKKAQLASYHSGKGAAGMALLGAGIGSIIPGIGTGIGAGVGAIIGGIYGLIKGLSTDVSDIKENTLMGERLGWFGSGGSSGSNSSMVISTTDDYIHPLTGGHVVTSGFGPRKAPIPGASTYHKGIDIDYKLGESIPAFRSGKVTRVGNAGNGGLTVTVDTGDYEESYMHLQSASVQVGDEIKSGQEIGKAGNSGNSKGPHLHYQTKDKKSGNFVDPLLTFPKDDGTGEALSYINSNGFKTTQNALNGIVA